MSGAQEQHVEEEGSFAVGREPLEEPLDKDGHEDEEDEEDDETSFGLPFEEKGQPGGYHTSNDPNARFHRATVTDRNLDRAIDIRGSSKAIVHGRLNLESDEYATLLVYDFTFNSTKRFRRVAWAEIALEFLGEGSNPEVHAVAPSGRWSLAETTQEEHVESSTSANLSFGFQGASAGGSQSWTKSVSREGKDATIIHGDTICNSYGKKTGAKFALLENELVRPRLGVPSFFRFAVLLARETDKEFQCTVNIEVEADWKTRMSTFFAAKTQDDPIYFDPGLPPMNKLKTLENQIDVENLGATRLDDIFDTTMYTTFKRAIKERD